MALQCAPNMRRLSEAKFGVVKYRMPCGAMSSSACWIKRPGEATCSINSIIVITPNLVASRWLEKRSSCSHGRSKRRQRQLLARTLFP